MRRALVVAICVVALVGGCDRPVARTADNAARRLREAVAVADSLRIRSGGACHRNEKEEKTLHSLTGNQKVLDFVKRVEFSECDGECECCGNPTFEFYRGKKLLAMVSFHHGTHLRWREGWRGDAYLTDASRDWLINWLAERGVTEPKKEVESSRQGRG